jgi:hypothetical protein
MEEVLTINRSRLQRNTNTTKRCPQHNSLPPPKPIIKPRNERKSSYRSEAEDCIQDPQCCAFRIPEVYEEKSY